jgi:ABC-type nickel/cobalt efflux system permease component RcnA
MDIYGKVSGPLNAKGILVSVDDRPTELTFRGFQIDVEEHPRFTFRFEMSLPSAGHVSIRDTNFASSEGTSRTAVRGRGVVIDGHGPLPTDVEQVMIRPVWQLTDDEERRTKQAEFDFRPPAAALLAAERQVMDDAESPTPDKSAQPSTRTNTVMGMATALPRLSGLLDAGGNLPWMVLGLLALALGALHALEPGHGKTLVTAVALGPDVRFYQPAILGLATTIAHTGSVLVIAAVLWWSGTSKVVPLHVLLTRAGGFAIAAAGFWRLGRFLGGYALHDVAHAGSAMTSNLGLIGLGLAGGLVPCWDAVALIVLAAALGQLAAGVGLVLAFSAGMGVVLLVLGLVACKARSAAQGLNPDPAWQMKLGLASASVLAAIGLFLFLQY